MFVVVVVVRVLGSFRMFSFLWKFKVDSKARKLSLRVEENDEKYVKVLLCVRVIMKRRKKERSSESFRGSGKSMRAQHLIRIYGVQKCSLTSLV